MSELQRVILQDGNTKYEIYVESNAPTGELTRGRTGKGMLNKSGVNTGNTTAEDDTHVQLQQVHKTIQGYTQYAIGAFKDLAVAEVEELNLKFNLKINAKSGLPTIASAETEASFSIEVKCKFKDNPASTDNPN